MLTRYSSRISANAGITGTELRLAVVWFAKTPAEAQNGAVLDGVSLNTIIDPIPQEDTGGHEPECVEGTYIYKGPAESRSGLGRSIVTMVQPTESHL